jgi:hypothetical protein
MTATKTINNRISIQTVPCPLSGGGRFPPSKMDMDPSVLKLQPVADTRDLDRLVPYLRPDDRVERQHMRPAQIVIQVRRRKSVEMLPADRGKRQRVSQEPASALFEPPDFPSAIIKLPKTEARSIFMTTRINTNEEKRPRWRLKLPVSIRPSGLETPCLRLQTSVSCTEINGCGEPRTRNSRFKERVVCLLTYPPNGDYANGDISLLQLIGRNIDP